MHSENVGLGPVSWQKQKENIKENIFKIEISEMMIVTNSRIYVFEWVAELR
jgi:hypothetical protein